MIPDRDKCHCPVLSPAHLRNPLCITCLTLQHCCIYTQPAIGTSPLPPAMPSSLACASWGGASPFPSPSMPRRPSLSGRSRPASVFAIPLGWVAVALLFRPLLLLLSPDGEGGGGEASLEKGHIRWGGAYFGEMEMDGRTGSLEGARLVGCGVQRPS